jgi:hypothetical protein
LKKGPPLSAVNDRPFSSKATIAPSIAPRCRA